MRQKRIETAIVGKKDTYFKDRKLSQNSNHVVLPCQWDVQKCHNIVSQSTGTLTKTLYTVGTKGGPVADHLKPSILVPEVEIPFTHSNYFRLYPGKLERPIAC